MKDAYYEKCGKRVHGEVMYLSKGQKQKKVHGLNALLRCGVATGTRYPAAALSLPEEGRGVFHEAIIL